MPSLRSSLRLTALLVPVGLVALACGGGGGSEFDDGADAGGSPFAGDAAGGTPGTGFASDGGATGGDGGGTGPACATGEAQATRLPVYLDIVLDGSRSMDGHGPSGTNFAACDNRHTEGRGGTCFLANGRETDPLDPQRSIEVCHANGPDVSTCTSFRGLTGKKWLAVRGALLATFETARTKADRRVGIGLRLFPNVAAKAPTAWEVEPGFVDAAQETLLRAAILPPVFPIWSGTPLRTNIDGQAALMKAFQPKGQLEAGGKPVLVVLTDGVPTGSGNSKAETETAVETLANATPPLQTFVVGVGNPTDDLGNFDETFLSRLAQKGGTALQGCDPAWSDASPAGTFPCHFQVTPGAKTAAQLQAELSAALESIAGRVQSCELTLQKNAPVDPAKVNVVFVDGTGRETQVPAGAADGWTFDDPASPNKVVLNGAACTALKADPNAKVTIVVGCPTGTPIR